MVMKILVTGAHFTPAKAVIEELSKRSDIKIIYAGRSTTMEGDRTPSAESIELPKLKVKYRTITAGRLRRYLDFYTLISLMKTPIGFIQGLYIVLSEKPDVILSFGGYVSVPIVFAGWLFSIPIIIHEQSLNIGLANIISIIFASKVCLSFPKKDLADKEIVTGNPLRQEILKPIRQISADYERIFAESNRNQLPVILVMGGNQGSHAINTTVEECLQELLTMACIIHVTGESKYNDFERLSRLQNKKYLVTKWIGDDLGSILSRVDLVLCRSGANTLTEISYFGVPVLTVPIKGHVEQEMNAQYFQKIGLAGIIYQKQLNPQNLIANIKNMLKNLDDLRRQAQQAKSLVIPDAAKRLALETILLAGVTRI